MFDLIVCSYLHCHKFTIVTTHNGLLHTMQGEGDGVHEPEEEISSSIVSIITKCISKSGRKELDMHVNIISVFIIVMQYAVWLIKSSRQ